MEFTYFYFILILSCILLNSCFAAYLLGLNPSSSLVKKYILHLIMVNLCILSDPHILNIFINYYQYLQIKEIRSIFWSFSTVTFFYVIIELISKRSSDQYKIYKQVYISICFIVFILNYYLNQIDISINNYYNIKKYTLFINFIFSFLIPYLHALYIIKSKNLKSKLIKRHSYLIFIITFLMIILCLFIEIFILTNNNYIYLFNYNLFIIPIYTVMITPIIIKIEILTNTFEKFISSIYQNSNDGLLVANKNGIILNMNNNIHKFFHMPIKQILGEKISNFIIDLDLKNNYFNHSIKIKNNDKKYYFLSTVKLNITAFNSCKVFLIKDRSFEISTEKELELNQLLYDKAQIISKTGNWEEDFINNTLTWSKNCKRLLGFSENDDINNKMFWSRVHPEDRHWMKKIWNKLQKKGKPHKQIFRILLDNGETKYIEEQAEFIFNDKKIIKTTGTIQDVSESYLAQEELKISEARLKEAQQVAQIGSFDYDLINEKVVWSDELYRIYGLKQDEYNPSNQGFFSLVHQNDRKKIKETISEAIKNQTLLEYDHRLIRSDNYEVRIMHCIAKITYENNKPIRIAGTSQDVTNIRKAQEEVRTSREQLRKLASHLQRAQEEERARISREIHDELGQELTGIKMDISWLSSILKNPQDEVRERINSLNKLIDTTINSVRRISSELRPGILDDLGLNSALEWYIDEFKTRTKINCDYSHNGLNTDINSELSITIYRIIQESLTNVARHSKATNVKIKFILDKNIVLIDIIDNGIGFDDDVINYEKSLGILGMEERVNIIGGSFDIEAKKNIGTRIQVKIPLKN